MIFISLFDLNSFEQMLLLLENLPVLRQKSLP